MSKLIPMKKKGKKKPEKKGVQLLTQVVMALVVIAMLATVLAPKRVTSVPVSEVARQVSAGGVTEIIVRGNKLDITKTDGTNIQSKKEPEASLSDALSNYGVTGEQLSAVSVDVKSESGFVYWLMRLLPIMVPIAFILVFVWYLSSQMRGGGGGIKALSFGQSKARVTDPNDEKKKVTFKDVAGNQEAKVELMEIVDFLKNPKKFFDVGAKIPKGVLLTGLPGTGKTLLARATAGEAGVPFFYLSGSEFVEMFVGVGASRVRDLFDTAKRVAPAIIFIDEIDAVGRARGVGFGGGNDEREQTLNQILVEMDGFEPTEKLVIMAATNRSDVLDSALLRPGRFDRQVYLDNPDRKDREAILRIHSKEKPLEDGIDFALIATRTTGFSGADLESLMNEAAILAARHDRKKVSQEDVMKSIEKVMMGAERLSHLHTPHERRVVAYHEAGHAIVASVLPHADPVHKVTIVARGHAGGYTLKLPLEEKKLIGKKELLDDLALCLGGYVTEKMVFDDVTTGPSNDLQVATRTARNMVMKWGMSDVLGPIAFSGSGKTMFGDDGMSSNKEYSDQVESQIDAEVSRMMKEAQSRALDVLTKHRSALDAVANKLLEVETLEQEEYNAIIGSFGIKERVLEK
jgi:cell division protease FtsH